MRAIIAEHAPMMIKAPRYIVNSVFSVYGKRWPTSFNDVEAVLTRTLDALKNTDSDDDSLGNYFAPHLETSAGMSEAQYDLSLLLNHCMTEWHEQGVTKSDAQMELTRALKSSKETLVRLSNECERRGGGRYTGNIHWQTDDLFPY